MNTLKEIEKNTNLHYLPQNTLTTTQLINQKLKFVQNATKRWKSAYFWVQVTP